MQWYWGVALDSPVAATAATIAEATATNNRKNGDNVDGAVDACPLPTDPLCNTLGVGVRKANHGVDVVEVGLVRFPLLLLLLR